MLSNFIFWSSFYYFFWDLSAYLFKMSELINDILRNNFNQKIKKQIPSSGKDISLPAQTKSTLKPDCQKQTRKLRTIF